MRQHSKSWLALIVLSLVLTPRPDSLAFIPSSVNIVPNAPNNMLRNPPFCFFASFLHVSLTNLINEPESS